MNQRANAGCLKLCTESSPGDKKFLWILQKRLAGVAEAGWLPAVLTQTYWAWGSGAGARGLHEGPLPD